MPDTLALETVTKILFEEGFLTEVQIQKIREKVAEEREKLIQLKKKELSHPIYRLKGNHSCELPVIE
ncbi:MAG: hypothetical protein N3A64_00440, partial [Desulfobacterota bacterium]|nr:hypothetical protein [Thermodesulfobacteriota bacterium]